MALRQNSTNTFEATFGEGSVRESRRGEMLFTSPEVMDYLQNMRAVLASAHVVSHSFTLSKKGRGKDVHVDAHFKIGSTPKGLKVLDNEDHPRSLRFELAAIRDGEFNHWVLDKRHKSVASVINLARDVDTIHAANGIALAARELAVTGPSIFSDGGRSLNEEEIQTRIIDRFNALLKTDVDVANKRLEKTIITLASTTGFQEAAMSVYYDALREKVHKALATFSDLEPDVMHRFVDELYCKKIHDS